jgi:hypothetical protein
MDGTLVGIFCELKEPEGIIYLPLPYDLIGVTNYFNPSEGEGDDSDGDDDENYQGQISFFFRAQGIDGGYLSIHDSVGSLNYDPQVPVGATFSQNTNEIYASTWDGSGTGTLIGEIGGGAKAFLHTLHTLHT